MLASGKYGQFHYEASLYTHIMPCSSGFGVGKLMTFSVIINTGCLKSVFVETFITPHEETAWRARTCPLGKVASKDISVKDPSSQIICCAVFQVAPKVSSNISPLLEGCKPAITIS